MFNLFKCKHPINRLVVEKEQTITPLQRKISRGFFQIDEHFEKITYHLVCLKCGENVKIEHAKTNHGVESLLSKKI